MSKLRESAQAMVKAWEDGQYIDKQFFRDLRAALAESKEDEMLTAFKYEAKETVKLVCGHWIRLDPSCPSCRSCCPYL